MGLYSVAGSGDNDSDLTMIASTANDTTLFGSQWTTYTRNFSASASITAGSLYAVGVLVVTSAAVPNFKGILADVTNLNSIAPMLFGQLSGQSDLGNVTAYVSASTRELCFVVEP